MIAFTRLYRIGRLALLCVVSIFPCVAVENSSSASQVLAKVTAVALSNQQAPGAAGLTFRTFGAPDLNNLGKVTFGAGLSCCGADSGVWSTGTGEVKLIALRNTTAVTGKPAIFTGFRNAQIDDRGISTITASANNVPPDFLGNWSGTQNDNLVGLSIPGDQIDGAALGTTYWVVDTPAVSSTGQMASLAQSRIPQGAADIIWISDGTSAGKKLVAAGDPATFEGGNVVFGTDSCCTTLENPVVNDNGQVAFLANLFDNSANQNLYEHIVKADPNGSFRTLVAHNDLAPEFGPQSKFLSLSFPKMNNLGQVAFGAIAGSSGGVDGKGIWVTDGNGQVRAVVKELDPAPGYLNSYFEYLGVTLNSDMTIAISDRGDVAFLAWMRGGVYGAEPAQSIWTGSPDGTLRPVVVEGHVAPGTSGGVFGDLYDELEMNTHSQVAIKTTVKFGPDTRPGLFATDRDGVMHAIAVYGDMIEVLPGDFRQVREVHFESSFRNVGGSGINDMGQVAFSVLFADGSGGVFISSEVAVPEPGTLYQALIGILVAAHRRRVMLTKLQLRLA